MFVFFEEVARTLSDVCIAEQRLITNQRLAELHFFDSGDTYIDRRALCLCNYEEIEHAVSVGAKAIVALSPDDAALPETGINLLLVRASVGKRIFNLVSDLFLESANPESYSTLISLVQQQAPVTELMGEVCRVFHNPTVVLNSSFRVFKRLLADDQTVILQGPENNMSESALEKYFADKLTGSVGPIVLKNSIVYNGEPCDGLWYSIKTTADRQICLVVCSYMNKITEADYRNIAPVARILSLAVRLDNMMRSEECVVREQLLLDVLNGHYKSLPFLEQKKSILPFRLDAKKCVMVVMRYMRDYHGEYTEHIQSRDIMWTLEQIIPETLCISVRDKLILVSNTNIASQNYENREALTEMLSEKGLRIGLSSVFSDSTFFQDAYRQAKMAVGLGMDMSPEEIIYTHSAYKIFYPLEEYGKKHSLSDMVHPAVMTLEKYDLENNTALSETLRVYLSCQMDSGKAAQRLFIHRNSLYYRLDKIRELIHLDYETDGNAFFDLQYSFKVFDYIKSQQKQ